MTLEYLAAGRVNVSEPHGESGRAGVAEAARTGLLRTRWVRRQFPQFPHAVLPIAAHGIGPVQRNTTRYCSGAGGDDREFFRTAIRARIWRTDRRKGVFALSPAISQPWTSRLPAERAVQAADDERAAPLEASMSMSIMPILSRRRSAGIRHNIAQFCQAAPSSPVIRAGLSHVAISVVSTEARRAERRDLFSTIGRLSWREGLSASRFALRSRRRKNTTCDSPARMTAEEKTVVTSYSYKTNSLFSPAFRAENGAGNGL